MRSEDHRQEPKTLVEVRDHLADVSITILSVLGLLAVIISLARVREFGWMAGMSVHLVVYLLVICLFIMKKKTPYHLKSGFLLVLLFVLGSGSFPSLGTSRSGVFFYLTIVVLATLFYGFAGGALSMAICTAALFAAFLATRAGLISPEVDLNLYVLSASSWTGKIAAFVLLAGLCLGLMNLMQHWLTGSIREMETEIEEGGFRLVVADDGAGLPPGAGKGQTLGLRLVETISQQLGASIEFSSNGGTSFTMLFQEYHEAGSQIF